MGDSADERDAAYAAAGLPAPSLAEVRSVAIRFICFIRFIRRARSHCCVALYRSSASHQVLADGGMDESTPRAVAEAGTGGTYGSRKARCEDALLEILGRA